MARRVCCTGGRSEGFCDWLMRLTRRSCWFCEARRDQNDDRLHVIRIAAGGSTEVLTIGSICVRPTIGYGKTRPEKRYYFHSTRAADEYVRRLNNGIPIRMEGLLVAAGAVLTILDIVVVVKVFA